MDMVGNDSNVDPQKGGDDSVNYHATNMSSDWQINGNNLANTSIGMIPICNSMVESSASMVESFCPSVWDQPMNGPNLGYCDVNVQNDGTTSSGLAMLRGGMFLPSVTGMLPQSLPHFPADSAFIERAARFSCFSGGNFGEMINPFRIHDPYSRSLGMSRVPHEVVGRAQRHEMNVSEVSKGTEGSPFKNDKKSDDEVKGGVGGSSNESDEAEFSGRGSQEESSGKGKKRKRGGQDAKHDENNEAPPFSNETGKDTDEDKQKGDQNTTSISKPGSKNVSQGSQGSDPPKEEYIHVRARRGQATNSHSLAERVRREKISERMKFLQDLVPGCSKVTGKAVMLDEIINYVQSLQRQVEFLSMKLATVNPRLDFNIEGLLAKDMLQSRAGISSSSLALLPELTMPFPPMHQPQPGLVQACVSAETLRRPINLQSPVSGGFKEPASQVSSVWNDELHNIVHMGFNSNTPLNTQDLSGSLPPGHMKAEP